MDKLRLVRDTSKVIIRERIFTLPGRIMNSLDLNPNDVAFFAYLSVVGVLILVFRSHLPLWPYYLMAQTALIVTAFLVIRTSQMVSWLPLTILRQWYPVLSFTFLYMQAGVLNQMVFSGYWDDFFARADLWIFGVEPGIWMFDNFSNSWLNELLHACYFSYYIIPVTLGLILYWQRDTGFYRAMFGFSVTFYICYFMYILIPVAGPIHLREGRFVDNTFFVHIMDQIYASVEKPGAAFPSSHVAIAVITLMYAWRLRRNFFWIVLPIILGLILSTVYGFYHYTIDVFAGIVVAVVSYYICNWIYDRYAVKYFTEEIP